MDKSKAREFIEVTGLPNEVAEKYLNCFGSFEEAVEHFLGSFMHYCLLFLSDRIDIILSFV